MAQEYSFAPGHLPRTQTNDTANAGEVGETFSATLLVGSGVSLTNNVVSNVISLALGAGDWEVSASAMFRYTGTTQVGYIGASLGTVSGGFSAAPGDLVQNTKATTAVPGATDDAMTLPTKRFSFPAGGGTVYLTAYAGFTVSTCLAYGIIRARPIR